MDYAAFRSFRDHIVREREVLRADCMNPARALARWRHAPTDASLAGDPTRALAAWTTASGLAIARERLVAGEGVRDLLRALFGILAPGELWLPGDVYPVYWQLASSTAPRPFATLPDLDLDFLADAGQRAVVVLPAPVTPLGRPLRPDEVEALRAWLAASPARRLVIDAVYTYDFAASLDMVETLLATDQCVLLWSCTKSWLCPDGLGVAAGPEQLLTPLRASVRPGQRLGHAAATLERQPTLPSLQQAAFAREWSRLAPALRAADPAWAPPATGYFSIIPRHHRDLLDAHGILAVPASVFGSPQPSISIVTCLHDLVLHADER